VFIESVIPGCSDGGRFARQIYRCITDDNRWVKMKIPTVSISNNLMPSRQRRTLLAAVLASYVASFVPWAAAQSQPAGSSSTEAAPDSFLQVSKLLTGQASLDVALAARLYRALLADDSSFGEQHQGLLAYIGDRCHAGS
jgi:hypothetical protein